MELKEIYTELEKKLSEAKTDFEVFKRVYYGCKKQNKKIYEKRPLLDIEIAAGYEEQ